MFDKVIDAVQEHLVEIGCFVAGAAVGYWCASPSSDDTKELVAKYEEKDKRKKKKDKKKKAKAKAEAKAAKKFMENIGVAAKG